ncbi:fatty acid desaturase family protein [Kineococcus gynurae]|uniref:Fatty acid desaturase family protein n=1 Tax=Kineococcus gynurae TaxID=452979 RepID=A0ABV5LWJ0_9ACTN
MKPVLTPAGPLEPAHGVERPARVPRSPYARLTAEVQALGLMARRRGAYAVRIAATTLALAAVVAGVVLLRDSWLVLLLGAPLALVLTQFAYLGHDAAHRQMFASHRRNEIAARIFAALVTGLGYGWWMGKHTKHHQSPNQRGIDTDIESQVVSFHEDAARSRTGLLAWFTRRQGWFFFPLLLVAGINLHVDSVKALLVGGRGRRADVALILLHWAIYATTLFTLLGPGRAAAFAGVHLAAFGLSMGGSFAPNHVGMPIVERTAKLDFISRQVRMSRNISGNRLVDLFMGGLNFQVEHHLFPSMPRPNLRAAKPIVVRFCQEQGIPYTETTLAGAYRDIVRNLNDVGLVARNPFRCPVRMQLRA